MIFKGEGRNNKVYAIVAIIVVIIVFLSVVATNKLTKAYISNNVLSFWYEDIEDRVSINNLFGLEKFSGFTYRNNNNSYPAYVTVTSVKTIFLMSEKDLLDRTRQALNNAKEDGIIIDENSIVEGKRDIGTDHRSMYVIYNGNDTSKIPNEKIKIIGETWNCVNSGTSIICIGFAQITDNLHDDSEPDLKHWQKIVGDPIGSLGFFSDSGLIYNVRCH